MEEVAPAPLVEVFLVCLVIDLFRAPSHPNTADGRDPPGSSARGTLISSSVIDSENNRFLVQGTLSGAHQLDGLASST